MSAQNLFNKLKSEGIIGAIGEVKFKLNGIETAIHDSSIVGNVIQEWLKSFMDKHQMKYRFKPNTQEFPDFLMHSAKDDVDLLEVKCFKKSPNFDVASFQAYVHSLLLHPYRLDADYLIFEYSDLNGQIKIENIWLRKVWEICGGSERSKVKIQWKKGVPFNIRPATWRSKKTKFPVFKTRLEFVQALKSVVDTNPLNGGIQKNWIKNVQDLYKKQTGNDL